MDTIETPAAQSSARGKAKRIVLCTDGTCNAFGRHSSNVTKLIELLDLSDECVQVAAYDQGLGTTTGQFVAIQTLRSRLATASPASSAQRIVVEAVDMAGIAERNDER